MFEKIKRAIRIAKHNKEQRLLSQEALKHPCYEVAYLVIGEEPRVANWIDSKDRPQEEFLDFIISKTDEYALEAKQDAILSVDGKMIRIYTKGVGETPSQKQGAF